MNIRTLYLDTSVIGGCFDHQGQESTTELFQQAASGLYQLAASVVTARELEEAPLEVQQFFATTFLESEQILELTAEAETLAQADVAAGVVTAKYVDDARHVANATAGTASRSWSFGIFVIWRISIERQGSTR